MKKKKKPTKTSDKKTRKSLNGKKGLNHQAGHGGGGNQNTQPRIVQQKKNWVEKRASEEG